MLDCCKTDTTDRTVPPSMPPPPQYKYSFRQRSHVPVNTFAKMTTSINSNLSEEDRLENEYQQILREHQDINILVQRNLKPLEQEVRHFEQQVIAREMEIKQLERLLQYVMERRGSNQPTLLVRDRQPFVPNNIVRFG
jgi:septal ring factor EnvC (AmiA/AmiB activator)